jgi:hypothetical protein
MVYRFQTFESGIHWIGFAVVDAVEMRSKDDNGATGLRAAQYVRMSTDEQDYSTLNQEESIAAYALAHNLTVVRRCSDEARSGLHLKELLNDVQSGQENCDVILVYDVSRWGVSKMSMRAHITNIYANWRAVGFFAQEPAEFLKLPRIKQRGKVSPTLLALPDWPE